MGQHRGLRKCLPDIAFKLLDEFVTLLNAPFAGHQDVHFDEAASTGFAGSQSVVVNALLTIGIEDADDQCVFGRRQGHVHQPLH